MKLQINTDKTTPQELQAMAAMLLELAGMSGPYAKTRPYYAEPTAAPVDLDIASGEPEVPAVVTVWTSKGNEELAKEHLNVNDTVGRVDVRLANEDDDKAKRKRKPRKAKALKEANRDSVREKLSEMRETAALKMDKKLAENMLESIQPKTFEEPATAPDPTAAREAKRAMLDALELHETPATAPDPQEVVETVVNVKTDKIEMEGSIDEALTAIDPKKPEGGLISDEQVARLRELRVEAAKLDVFPEFRKIIVDAYGQAGKFAEIPLDVANEILPALDELVTKAAEEGATVAE